MVARKVHYLDIYKEPLLLLDINHSPEHNYNSSSFTHSIPIYITRITDDFVYSCIDTSPTYVPVDKTIYDIFKNIKIKKLDGTVFDFGADDKSNSMQNCLTFEVIGKKNTNV